VFHGCFTKYNSDNTEEHRMKLFLKDFIVLSTLFVVIVLIIANPFTIVWAVAFLWALGIFNVQA